MADYSYITVRTEDTPHVRKIVDPFVGSDVELWENELPGTITIIAPEARYGFPDIVPDNNGGFQWDGTGDEGFATIVLALMEAGYAWTGHDEGGYEWAEMAYEWKPGWDRVARRTHRFDEAVLTRRKFQAILGSVEQGDSYGAVEVVKALQAYYAPGLNPDIHDGY